MQKWTVLLGDTDATSLRAVGPFDSRNDAYNWATEQDTRRSLWFVAPLPKGSEALVLTLWLEAPAAD